MSLRISPSVSPHACVSVCLPHWPSISFSLSFFGCSPSSSNSCFQAAEATNRSDAASSAGGDLDVVALTMVQSAFRGHLARCSRATERWLTLVREQKKMWEEQMQSNMQCFLKLCVCVCVCVFSSGFSVPSLMGNKAPTLSARRAPSTHTPSTTGEVSPAPFFVISDEPNGSKHRPHRHSKERERLNTDGQKPFPLPYPPPFYIRVATHLAKLSSNAA